METYRILLIDAQGVSRRELRTQLEKYSFSFQVVDVPSGEEGFLEFTRQPVDLVISEVRLPGMSGLELSQKVRARQGGVKIILISNQSDPKINRAAQSTHVDVLLNKPLQEGEFIDAVLNCLGIDELAEELAQESPVSQSVSLSEPLRLLHQDTDAQAVILLDERGQVTAQAGNLPENYLPSALITAVMAASSAGAKISRFLNFEQPLALCFFLGKDYHLAIAPLGHSFTLLVVTCYPPQGSKLDQALTRALEELIPILTDMGVTLVEPALPEETAVLKPELLLEIEKPDHDLEELLIKGSQARVSSDEVNAFWDSLAQEEQASTPGSAELISFEQALRLGLSPEEEK